MVKINKIIHYISFFLMAISCKSTIDVLKNDKLLNAICPSGYVLVRGNSELATDEFCVMSFEAKNESGSPVSKASGLPWGSLNADEAFEACESLNGQNYRGRFSLITNSQWMTIARDIENTASNWSGGFVGGGKIPRGHSDGSPADPIAITDITEYYSGTGNSSADAIDSGWEQKRIFVLSNGNIIWDFAGNAYEWVDWSDSDSVFTLGPTNEGSSWKELSVDSIGVLLDSEYKPSNDSFDSSFNFGQWFGGTGGAALRGGTSDKNEEAGIFTLLLVVGRTGTSVHFGFRCVYNP